MTAGSADGQSGLLPVVIVGGIGTGVLLLGCVKGCKICMILRGEEEACLHCVGVDHGLCLPCESADTTAFPRICLASWSTAWKWLPGTSVSTTTPSESVCSTSSTTRSASTYLNIILFSLDCSQLSVGVQLLNHPWDCLEDGSLQIDQSCVSFHSKSKVFLDLRR